MQSLYQFLDKKHMNNVLFLFMEYVIFFLGGENMTNFMTSKVSEIYCKDKLVQLMIPFCSNMTLIGPNGIMFHCFQNEILINEYLSHSKREQFLYSKMPTHVDANGAFANQLFEFNQTYLSIYNYNGKLHFRKDFLYQCENAIFNERETPITLEKKSKSLENIESLESKYEELAQKFNSITIISSNGRLVTPSKELLKYLTKYLSSSFSGVLVGTKENEIMATMFEIKKNKENLFLETKKLILDNFDFTPNYDLENPEPFFDCRLKK